MWQLPSTHLSGGQTASASFLAYVLLLVHDDVEPRFSLKKYSVRLLGFLRRPLKTQQHEAVSSTVG